MTCGVTDLQCATVCRAKVYLFVYAVHKTMTKRMDAVHMEKK